MTTLIADRSPQRPAPSRMPRPSLGRLTVVELRKMTDTRAGAWLLVIIGLIAAGIVVLQLLTDQGPGRSFAGLFSGTVPAVSILLPVLGILSVTSEWSQRTIVATFTLVPARWRVIVAKLAAGAVLAAASVVACLAAAAIGNLFVGPAVAGSGAWTVEAATLGTALLYQLIAVGIGMAFGMLLLNTPLAIVLYFVLPTVLAILTGSIDALSTVREWLDQTVSLTPLTTGELTGQDWAQVAATTGVWLLLPLILGLVRVLRREVS